MVQILTLEGAKARVTSDDLLASIKEDLIDNSVRSVSILFLPYDVLTRARVTPELLQGSAEFRIVVQMDDRMRKSLLSAIESSQISPLDSAPDLRWGAVLQSEKGSTLHSIYLSGKTILGKGRQGIIDGQPVKLNGAMIAWFEASFPAALTIGNE